MFEGLVWQLLLGYLGQYIRVIQTEQLKITRWNEEVLLENVELILEAFDYLQFPFALKQGHVGKLSIRIPWKKLGWDLVIIILEDVLICASQRDEKEVSAEDMMQMLDEIEKESDNDEILSYEFIAERELQDILLASSSNSVNTAKPLEDGRPFSMPRGWLNWLSQGMFGVGGTDGSSQFSGIISDDIINLSTFLSSF